MNMVHFLENQLRKPERNVCFSYSNPVNFIPDMNLHQVYAEIQHCHKAALLIDLQHHPQRFIKEDLLKKWSKLYGKFITWYICCSDSWLTVFWGYVIVFTSFSTRPSLLPPNHHLVFTRPPTKKNQSKPGKPVTRNHLQACPAVQTCAELAASKT